MPYDVLTICKYIIKYSSDKKYLVSNLKLQKMLYYIQAYFLVINDSPCFREDIQAWNFGSVVPEAYQAYKKYGGCEIPFTEKDLPFQDINKIAQTDKLLLNEAIDKLNAFSAVDLMKKIHQEKPWIDAYAKGTKTVITLNAIKDFFK